MQSIVYNFPSFSILLTLMAGMSAPFIRNGRVAQKVNFGVITVVGIMNAILCGVLLATDTSYTYMMGHFPAPWGNELRAGPLEAILASCFCLVMALSILGGLKDLYRDIRPRKQYLYFLMLDLMLASLLTLIYTNDLFNAYVFIEINTVAACAIVMIKEGGETLVATIRYLIMSVLGSGLFLFGVCILYGFTGNLLMSSIQETVIAAYQDGTYAMPMTVVIGLLVVGLAMKSAIVPFHSWLPNAHGSSTGTSSAILSGLVLKGYLVLLIKLVYNVFTPEIFSALHVNDVILILGVLSMIYGSVKALRQQHIKRMIAYSSVAQIGYIFMGIGMGSEIGLIAACYHMLAHAFTKPMMFLAAGDMVNAAGHNYNIKALKGMGRERPLAGIGFTVGSLSMIGIPLFAGFAPKVFFATGAIQGNDWFRLVLVLVALSISTALNALYYLPACINIWTSKKEKAYDHGHGHEESHGDAQGEAAVPTAEHPVSDVLVAAHPKEKLGISFIASIVLFIACNFALGLLFTQIATAIQSGVALLG